MEFPAQALLSRRMFMFGSPECMQVNSQDARFCGMLLERIMEGRTDLVFEYLAEGHAATDDALDGVSSLQWCSYNGDVSAMKFLSQGARIESLWENLGLIGACSMDTGGSPNSCLRTALIQIEPPSRVSRPAASCGTAAPRARLRCTAPPLSAMKRRSRCCSTPGP